eukprot:9478144-Pyramimonas_sp.AAC.1
MSSPTFRPRLVAAPASATNDEVSDIPSGTSDRRRRRRRPPIWRGLRLVRDVMHVQPLRKAGILACMCGRAVAFAMLLQWRPDEQYKRENRVTLYIYNVGVGMLATTV